MSSMLVGKLAPFFKAQAYLFREGKHEFKEISLDHYKNKYLVLFFYPLNFTFACPTEIIQFNNLALKHAESLNVLGVSVDSKFSHMEYVNKPRNKGGLGGISFPLLSDLSHKISKDYGVLSQDGISFRGTFIIAPDQTIKHSSINFPGIGRNVEEYGRLVEACAHNEKHGEVCPANWKKGDPTMKPDVNSQQLNKYWQDVHSKK